MTQPHGQTIADIICERWKRTISEIEDPRIDEESARGLIKGTRQILRDAGVSPIEEHYLLMLLRDLLPALTNGHPICKQFIELLDLELKPEFN